MTSMLLTQRIFSAAAEAVVALWVGPAMTGIDESLSPPRRGGGNVPPRLRRLVASFRALRPRLVLGQISRRRRIKQRHDLVLHGRDPVRDLDPLSAVPLLHIGGVMAVVILAGHLDRRAEIRETDLLPARRWDLQCLKTAPYIIAGDHLLAGDLLRVADGLGNQHRIIDASLVQVLADLLLRRLAVLADHVFLYVLDRWELVADRIEVQR